MRQPLIPFIAAAVVALSSASQAQVEKDYLSTGPIFIQNINIIDGMGNPPMTGQDVLVKDGKIASIRATGASGAPDGATTIDGTGLTAMPGLIEMHFHLKGGWSGGNALQEKYPPDELLTHKAIQQNLAALLYAGVTTGLDMGSTQSFIVEEKRKIDAGEYIAPRYHVVGVPFSQEPSGWDGAVRGETIGEPPADALATKIDTHDPLAIGIILQRYREDGIRIIKLYSGMGAHAATFLIKEADKRGITTIADLWKLNMSSEWMRATNLHGWAHATPTPVSQEGLKWMVENDKFVVPTITVGEKLSGLRVADEHASEALFDNPLVMNIWGREVVRDFYDSYPQVRKDLYDGPLSFYQMNNFGVLTQFRQAFLENVKKAHDAGVLLACGTDAPAYPTLWAGEAMHREMELFAMAGVPPLEIIKACTYNAAKILKEEEEYGSIQEGLDADILIVSGDPATKISDSRNIEYVIVRGGLLDRQKLLTSWH